MTWASEVQHARDHYLSGLSHVKRPRQCLDRYEGWMQQEQLSIEDMNVDAVLLYVKYRLLKPPDWAYRVVHVRNKLCTELQILRQFHAVLLRRGLAPALPRLPCEDHPRVTTLEEACALQMVRRHQEELTRYPAACHASARILQGLALMAVALETGWALSIIPHLALPRCESDGSMVLVGPKAEHVCSPWTAQTVVDYLRWARGVFLGRTADQGAPLFPGGDTAYVHIGLLDSVLFIHYWATQGLLAPALSSRRVHAPSMATWAPSADVE